MDTWHPIARVYHPLTAGSIDGTDTRPHDRAVERAIKASYVPPSVDNDPHLTLFVARLNPETTEKTLRKTFSKYGDIKQVNLIRDIVTGFSKQYAFIEFEEERSARRARAEADQSVIEEHIVFVDWECEHTLDGWIPRRLGGGLGGKKESGQLRFGGRDRPFRKPILVQARNYDHRDKEIRDGDRERDRENKDRDRGIDRNRDREIRDGERGIERDRDREDRDRDRDKDREDKDRGIGKDKDTDTEDGEIRDRDREYSRDRDRRIGRVRDIERDHRGRDRGKVESRERLGDRYRDKDRDRYRERERDRHKDSDRDRHRHRDRRKEKNREREGQRKERKGSYRERENEEGIDEEVYDGREQNFADVKIELSSKWDDI